MVPEGPAQAGVCGSPPHVMSLEEGEVRGQGSAMAVSPSPPLPLLYLSSGGGKSLIPSPALQTVQVWSPLVCVLLETVCSWALEELFHTGVDSTYRDEAGGQRIWRQMQLKPEVLQTGAWMQKAQLSLGGYRTSPQDLGVEGSLQFSS